MAQRREEVTPIKKKLPPAKPIRKPVATPAVPRKRSVRVPEVVVPTKVAADLVPSEPVAPPSLPAPPLPEAPYYDRTLSTIPKRRNATDRLYRLGKSFRVTSGAPIDGEIELSWPPESI